MNTAKCISPIDGSLYAERPYASLDEARAKIEAARKAQIAWAARPLEERVALVSAGVKRIGEETERMTTELAWQMGRPVRYGGEWGGFVERADYMAKIAGQALAPTIVETSEAVERRILRVPHGVAFVIAPWNYPYLTANNTIGPALIAGNAVILKHAAQTLLVGEHLVEAFTKAGVPEDVFVNLVLDHQITETLIGERAFDFINFTGSVAGGKAIEKAAAGTFTPLGLELAGKDPGYVREDADVDNAVAILIDGAMFNSGQCCCGIERIYVHESLYDAFVEKAVEMVKGYKLGNPLDQETTIGPMAHKRFAETVRAQVSEANAAGAKAHLEPFEGDDGGAYVSPQVLTNVDHSMRVMMEETFGPVVGIMKVKDDEEAIGLMNDSPYGLTASIVTKDAEAAGRIGERLRTGTVFMNRADYVDPALCWTGCKDTGRGGAMSAIGYQNLTRPQSFHLKKA